MNTLRQNALYHSMERVAILSGEIHISYRPLLILRKPPSPLVGTLCTLRFNGPSRKQLRCPNRSSFSLRSTTAPRGPLSHSFLPQLRRRFSTHSLLRFRHQHPNEAEGPSRKAAHYQDSTYPSVRAEAHDFISKCTQWGFMGAFVLIFLGLASQGQRPSSPPKQLTQKNPIPHLTLPSSFAKYITTANFTYRRADWPPQTVTQCVPYLTYNFAHSSPSHLLMNSLGFYFLTSALFPTMGILTTVSTFLIGGSLASQLDCAVSKAYATGQYPELFQYIKAGSRDPRPQRTLSANCLGASSALCCLLMTTTLARPLSRWSLMFIPVGVPLVLITGAEVTWEAWSFYTNVDDGVGHSGHLAGHLAGVVLWMGWLRWTRYGRLCRQIRWLER